MRSLGMRAYLSAVSLFVSSLLARSRASRPRKDLAAVRRSAHHVNWRAVPLPLERRAPSVRVSPLFFTLHRSDLHRLFTKTDPLLGNLVFGRRYCAFTSSATVLALNYQTISPSEMRLSHGMSSLQLRRHVARTLCRHASFLMWVRRRWGWEIYSRSDAGGIHRNSGQRHPAALVEERSARVLARRPGQVHVSTSIPDRGHADYDRRRLRRGRLRPAGRILVLAEHEQSCRQQRNVDRPWAQ